DSENDSKLLVLKAEKERDEYYNIAGLNNIIGEIYYLIKEWVKEFSNTNNFEKAIARLSNLKILEAKIKGLVEKNKIDHSTSEKYLEVIKKSLKNLNIEKCSRVELFSESTSLKSEVKPAVQVKSAAEVKIPETAAFSSVSSVKPDNSVLSKIESS